MNSLFLHSNLTKTYSSRQKDRCVVCAAVWNGRSSALTGLFFSDIRSWCDILKNMYNICLQPLTSISSAAPQKLTFQSRQFAIPPVGLITTTSAQCRWTGSFSINELGSIYYIGPQTAAHVSRTCFQLALPPVCTGFLLTTYICITTTCFSSYFTDFIMPLQPRIKGSKDRSKLSRSL